MVHLGFLSSLLVAGAQLHALADAASPSRGIPLRTIAGVDVVDTRIVRDAQNYALQHSSDWLYKHVMRSWLFGAIIISHNETLRESVDLEAHAVATILHDIGWDRTPGSPVVSSDKRFEVDGAIAAREFIRNHREGRRWDEHRLQLVWDSIALHTTQSIYNYKEPVVMVVGNSILVEFIGPQLGIDKSEYEAVLEAFPNDDLIDGFNSTLIWLCQHKPLTTIDNFQQPWGEHYVENYTTEGLTIFDHTHGISPRPGNV